MKANKKELIAALQAIKQVPVLVIGDLILDRYIWGKVERISPEAPVPVVEVKKNDDRLGGAANVARNLRGISAKVSICGCVGDDEEGQVVLKLLEKESIEREGVLIDRGRPTSVKTRVISGTQQIVRIDREKKDSFGNAFSEGFAAVVQAHLESSKAIIISDYGKGVIGEAVLRRLSESSKQGLIGLTARPLILDPHPRNYGLYKDITVVKPNRKEAEIASGISIVDKNTAQEAARLIMQRWGAEMVLITLGEDGLMILGNKDKEPQFVDTVARQVFDVSGAGDTVTAIFSAALAAGATPLIAGQLANIGAGIVVSEVGTVSVTEDKMMREIELLN